VALFRDVECGGQVEVDLSTNHKLKFTDSDSRKVVVKLIYKRGNKFARLAIDAPDDVVVEVLPPDGVQLAPEGA